jgi:type II secretory pathway pseudopilin PulG
MHASADKTVRRTPCVARSARPRATRPQARASRHEGFTFLGLLFLIILMGLMAAAAAATWSFTGQREKELDLLYVGREYRIAIERYRAAHATEPQPFPTALAALLGDDHRLAPRRFIRHLYFDPITGSDAWGLERNAKGGITGVYSLSERVPVRTVPVYADETIAFGDARSYRDWVFTATPKAGGAGPAGSASAPTTSASTPTPGEGPQQAVNPGAVPGWNYDRDGEPPPKWPKPRQPAPDAGGT